MASDPGLLVMVSLLGGPRHGYAISEDIEALTGDRPGPGTLYGAIARLEQRGLIEAREGDGRRKPYALTRAGVAEVRRLLEGMETVTRAARRRLRVQPA
ncbi:MAG: PadR family transcriptional regulator [Acidimicrobiales bacterium]